MADRPRLTNPVCHVIMADGADLEATCTNADLVAYDLSRGAKKWPMPNVSITTRRPDGSADQVDVDPTQPDPESG